jgi:tetratricopeptide (TPR) repeat protein
VSVRLARFAGRVLAGFLVVTLMAGSARAEPQDKLAQARAYFNVGVRAYAAGQYGDAVQAFQQAYKLTPREGLLFSLAQAHRKQYYVGRKADDLRAAIKYYHQYLDRVTRGGRRSDAADALAELEPLAAKLETEAAPTAVVPEAKPVTQVMISSPTLGVHVDIDGRRAGKLPLVSDVAPGKHRVRLSARGYQDYVRDIVVLSGSTVPIDQALADTPARLSVLAPNGAQVSIDGAVIGAAPLPTLRLAPGKHFVAVTANGRRPFSRELSLERGQVMTLDAPLAGSTQRAVSYILLGAGASSFVASGVLALGAYQKQKDAEAILDHRTSANISAEERDAYASFRDRRDGYRTASIVAAGAGLALAGTGVALFVFDEPHVTPPAAPRERRPLGPEAPAQLEISALPSVGPGSAGATLFGRF